MELINKDTKNRKYTLNSLKTYNLVMNLRRKTGWGTKRIKEYLEKKGINSSTGAIRGWVYKDKKPFVYRIIKQIPESSKELTKEKAYILGTLCGDGYISTGYRIGLGVCDKDFADYFKYCVEKVYGVRCSIRIRITKPNKFCKNPKPLYIVSQVSKLIVRDLNRYSTSFKTKEWKVPEQIKGSSKKIQSAFIRGFADSEGSARCRKAHSEICLCSGNKESLEEIKHILDYNFNIKSYLGDKVNKATVISITKYIYLKKFHDEIGFIIKRKQENLKKGLNSYKRKGVRSYPLEFKLKAMNLLKQGMKHREIARLLGTNRTNIYDWEKSYLKKLKEEIQMKKCQECGTLIQDSYNLCYNCWQIRKTNSGNIGKIPEPIKAKSFMDKMGISGWNR